MTQKIIFTSNPSGENEFFKRRRVCPAYEGVLPSYYKGKSFKCVTRLDTKVVRRR